MNITPRLLSVSKSPEVFLKDYLKSCGVKDIPTFLNPDDSVLDNPTDYKDFESGLKLFRQVMINRQNIGIIVDSDLDGICSASLINNFIRSHRKLRPTLFLHEGKQHGLKDVFEQVKETQLDLLIIPDAGSDNIELLEELCEMGMSILILDHHKIADEVFDELYQSAYRNQIALINPNHFDAYRPLDTHICGTAVTWQFVRGYCEQYKVNLPYYLDLVGVATIADVMDLSSLSNRYFVETALTNPIENEMLNLVFEKKLRKGLNSVGIGWDIGPLFNAVCRADDMEIKELVVKAMSGLKYEANALKGMVSMYNRQTNNTKRIQEYLVKNMITDHVVDVAFGEVEDAPYLGLCANKLLSASGKPTFVLRELNETTWSGSLRSPVPISQAINESGCGKAMGHDEAAGLIINKNELDNLLSYLDSHLDLGFEPNTVVTAIVKPKELTVKLVNMIKEYERIWGNGVPSPTFYISGKCLPSNISIFRKRTNTLKFVVDGVEFVKFFAKERELEQVIKAIDSGVEVAVNMVVTPELNEWNGVTKAQGLIEKFEINWNMDIDEKSFEELF